MRRFKNVPRDLLNSMRGSRVDRQQHIRMLIATLEREDSEIDGVIGEIDAEIDAQWSDRKGSNLIQFPALNPAHFHVSPDLMALLPVISPDEMEAKLHAHLVALECGA